VTPGNTAAERSDTTCEGFSPRLPAEVNSADPEVLRAALIREATERRRGECLASMQAEIVQLAVDLLVQQPNIEGFFGALTKTMVEEGESHACGVWLIDDSEQRCEFWLAYVNDRLLTTRERDPEALTDCPGGGRFPCESMGKHLFAYDAGWRETVQYIGDDPRLPDPIRAFSRDHLDCTITTPLRLGDRTLGWMTVSCLRSNESEHHWWRVELIEAIARQAALALHHSRVVERSRSEERSKAILEERNRLARDIHDNLAQGFAAILMQLQGARREVSTLTPSAAVSVETAIELARTHLAEAARRWDPAKTSPPRSNGWRISVSARPASRSMCSSRNCPALVMASSARSSASPRRR
jgi:signal transduction histidine kinase